MRTRSIWVCLSLTMFAVLLGQLMSAQTNSGTGTNAFFAAAALSQDSQYVTPFASMPPENTALDTRQYGKVVEEIIRWNRRLINAAFLPTDAYVKENVKLFKASKSTFGKDVAFLTYSEGKDSFMAVHSGGVLGRFCLFVKVGSVKSSLAPEEVKQLLKTYTDKLLASDVSMRVGTMSGFQNGDTLEMKPGRSTAVVLFSTKDEICISLDKETFQGKLDALLPCAPQADRWFEYLMVRRVPPGLD